MIKDLLNKDLQLNYIEETKDLYTDLLYSFRESVNEDSETDLSIDFQNFFKVAITREELDTFNTQNFYFFSLLQKVIHVLSLHEDLVISDTLELSESEDELFNLWHDSEFAKDFLFDLNDSKDLLAVSKKYLVLLEEQCESYFNIHIAKLETQKENIRYQRIPEIGDSEQRLFSLTNNSYTDNITSIQDLKFDNKGVTCEEMLIHSSSLEIDSTLNEQIERIKDAISVIREINVDLYATLERFTKVIVPIKEEGIVSYSMQSLPHISCINLYSRDFHDIMDDLLHENGHHYLNFILNTNELIYEDDEKIYYSAWRQALRPVRGIYHAYFTFYWAFKLYKSLAYSSYQYVNKSEEKILQRLLEEALMMDFTWHEVQRCHQDGKVSEDGLDLVMPISEEISDFMKNDFQNLYQTVSEKYSNAFQSINNLGTKLKEAKDKYII